jgi:hypothetical protein
MGIAVLTEPVEGGFRAASGPPLEAEVIAESRDEAKKRLLELLSNRINHGVEVDTLELPLSRVNSNRSLAKFVGDMKSDPLYEPWQDAIKAFREERDAQAEW